MSVLESVKDKLIEAVKNSAVKSELVSVEELPEISLEVPKDKSFGDFSTNLAMQLTRIAKKNPRQIAEQLKEQLDYAEAGVENVEIAGPGFINFYLDKRYLHEVISDVLMKGARYGAVTVGNHEKIQVEFVSANPTGSLHLGHARGAAVGDALCNLLDFAGYDVSREYYINDAGNQIDNLAKSIEARYLQQLEKEAEMPEDGYHGEDIIQFAKELAAEEHDRLLSLEGDEKHEFFKRYGLEKEMQKLKNDLTRFGVEFDVWFSETSLYQDKKTDAVLEELESKGHTYEQDGALWLKTTPFGDDKDRVLIKNDGSFTYLTPDIAYHKDKFNRGFNQLINIWGADHHGYIPRMRAAITALGYEPDQLKVLVSQMVSLYQNGEKVKMSKRTGKAVTMKELMDEVGVDAIRYFFTMRGIDSHLDFDIDLAISTSNENPVYYVQYAYARICSIFRQADEQGIARMPLDQVDLHLLDEESEYNLLLKVATLYNEVQVATEQYAPHRIIRYVYELASLFHSYYKAQRVILEDDEKLTQARLSILAALKVVFENCFKIIGISAPEKM
ncbi:arginine--tRNA ligase [Chengkuizengella axinellae]|uniref:Arginine--tRNA ligase n=1 Tax=Chengkuizengella axinellae TaxID=3064388 RepID=A0ABT9IZV6_9BACL|nr:arginine--tRNA ligase [Chengkuizengella sp. 2205SS18-9]MDP5274667.1 arginine--tRNA ligase [Chengkuizengella sp. 2205SS18-9]